MFNYLIRKKLWPKATGKLFVRKIQAFAAGIRLLVSRCIAHAAVCRVLRCESSHWDEWWISILMTLCYMLIVIDSVYIFPCCCTV
jgi:hypothetical protein